ncbi:ribokinase [Microbacterium deminutum]|uniref:Ribokinase n=1 Tax=Microbacterium deminutum TaxID=344164 RepID=A0ABN2QTC7_9MICO
MTGDPRLGNVVVAGSINVDTFLRVPHLPAPGETLIASRSSVRLGGKGANQAMAARRAGCRVTMVGAVGDDRTSRHPLRVLASSGVDAQHVQVIRGAATGSAVIAVDDAGENLIIVDPGANARLERFEAAAALADAAVLVVQGEMPMTFTAEAVVAASRVGVRVIVNLAPFTRWLAEFSVADPLILNEVEAGQLLGAQPGGPEDIAEVASRLLGYCRSAVVTIGARGAVLVTESGALHIAAPSISDVIDSTGAGDAFVGVTAAALAFGRTLPSSVRAGVEAASESVRHEGAGESYPDFISILAR